MKFTATESGFPLPPGTYPATFLKIVDYENPPLTKREYKEEPLVKLKFDPIGEHSGKDIYVSCTKKFTTKSKLFGFGRQMAGGELNAGDDFDFDQFIGKKFLLHVGPKPEGDGNTVTGITPMPV